MDAQSSPPQRERTPGLPAPEGAHHHRHPVSGGSVPSAEPAGYKDAPSGAGGSTEPLPTERLRELEQRRGGGGPGASPAAARENVPGPRVFVDNASFSIEGQPQEFATPSLPEEEPIDRVPWAARIPRCCGTCRDFRRGSDGHTGVCKNPYAFADESERVVESDQLACRWSGGVFWLPNDDDAWRERVDTSRHTRPTPHLDAALGQLNGRD
ncbi:MAG: hypothetical protein ACOC9Y_01015 [Chloroflexota bacterium]